MADRTTNNEAKFNKVTPEGFKTGEIFIEVFGEHITLPDKSFFRDDGEVDSILQHTYKLFDEFGVNKSELTESEIIAINETTGMSRRFEVPDGRKYSISFVLPENENRGPEFQIFNKAHEIAHSIYDISQTAFDELIDKLSKKLGYKIDLSNLDEEDTCRIVGLMGLEVNNIPSNVFNNHKDFKEAHQLLIQRRHID